MYLGQTFIDTRKDIVKNSSASLFQFIPLSSISAVDLYFPNPEKTRLNSPLAPYFLLGFGYIKTG